MTNSMTGFASGKGQHQDWAWVWDLRGVNGRGFDLRLRLPDWIEGLEPLVRARLKKSVSRGNMTVGLKIRHEAASGGGAAELGNWRQALARIRQIEELARAEFGYELGAMNAADVSAMAAAAAMPRDEEVEDISPLLAALEESLGKSIEAFNAMRAQEGAVLSSLLASQIDKIEALTRRAHALAGERQDHAREVLRRNLARVMENTEGLEPQRLAQELALIAVKNDVTEELDRLGAHVQSARKLLEADGPVGRKLDFLTQEFNREANTLCSKAQYQPLSQIGLDLKAVIDQMREQVQNVE